MASKNEEMDLPRIEGAIVTNDFVAIDIRQSLHYFGKITTVDLLL
jgi:hypothetical protein